MVTPCGELLCVQSGSMRDVLPRAFRPSAQAPSTWQPINCAPLTDSLRKPTRKRESDTATTRICHAVARFNGEQLIGKFPIPQKSAHYVTARML